MNQLHQIDKFRSEKFYQYINDLDNVSIIGFKNNHKDLIMNAELIVSNTGTVFREASYAKKYCLTFSNKSLYNCLDNVFYVNDSTSCKKAIQQTLDIKHSFKSIDKIFNQYTYAIVGNTNITSELFAFIIENKLYKVNNE